MFQSIHYVSYEGCRDGLYHYKYGIVDSEFGMEEAEGATVAQIGTMAAALAAPSAVINCYRSKKQNVPHNLALYHLYMAERYSWYPIEKQIKWCIEYLPQYPEYSEAVQSYLTRINNLRTFW